MVNFYVKNLNEVSWAGNIQDAIQEGPESFEEGLNTGRMHRHVAWLKQKSKKLKIGEDLLLAATVVGIPVAYKLHKISNRMKLYQDYKSEAEQKNPPKNFIIQVKTDTQTFNHVNEYIIYENFIWFRKRNDQEQEWTPLFFDGFPEKQPIKIQADGANLIVIDDKNYVHYKKVLKEDLRIFEKEAKKASHTIKPSGSSYEITGTTHKYKIKNGFVWVRRVEGDRTWRPLHFEGWPNTKPETLELKDNKLIINGDYELDCSENSIEDRLEGQFFPYKYHYAYSAITTDSKDNWEKRWFNLPVFKRLNFSREKRLQLPQGANAVISNRSAFVGNWKDDAGVEHPNYISVTTLYLLSLQENCIYYADPWLPFEFNEHSLPRAGTKRIDFPIGFKPEKLCASGSVLLVCGTDPDGNPALISRLADFDTEMINPFLPYAEMKDIECKNKIDTELRIRRDNFKSLPVEVLWSSISLDDIGNLDQLDFETLTIFQTGLSNNAKELRIEKKDRSGFYSKELRWKEEPWSFEFYHNPLEIEEF